MDEAASLEIPAETVVELVPTVLDAGAETTIRVILTGAQAQGLAGRTLDIVDGAGVVSDRLLLRSDPAGGAVGTCRLRAPDEPGRTVWTAHLPQDGSDASAAFQLAFEVRAHDLTLTVWDVPLAVERGARFRVQAGLRCSAGCDLSAQAITIGREGGADAVTTRTGHTPKAGTDAVYWTEIELDAPPDDGKAVWECAATAIGLAHPHAEAVAQIAVNVVPPAKHRIRVSVVDAETSAPIARAKVVAHPFRTFTDAEGRAELRLPPGRRRLFVSGPDHIPYQVEGDVTEDIEIIAALDRDRPMTEAEIWT